MCAGVLAALALAVAPASAFAATGGVSAPAAGTGGVVAGTVPLPAKLSVFTVSSKRLRAGGRPVKVRYRIDGGATRVAASLRISAGGSVVKTIALGNVTTGVRHTYALAPDSSLPRGTLVLRIRATGLRTSARRKVVFTRPATPAPAPPPPPAPDPDPAPAPASGHAFPLRGSFTYGDGFGVDRPGHTHQGQDLLAAKGTPIVAARGGTVTFVDYQAGGAGWYVVISGAGEDLDYAYMHMVEGSVLVRKGQSVSTGQPLGLVGQTGAASGPHLHFEIWQGAWQQGGRPIDPLPYLKSWH
jgi:murein DD-endopeptidase MepM/ murein hydrolase activator NlpD